MTEYEMADMAFEISNFRLRYFEFFATLLFAFLIASYLASAKLTRPMMIIVIGLFSVIAATTISAYANLSGVDAALQKDILLTSQIDGSGLRWMRAAATDSYIALASQVNVAVMIGSYLAALVFFFYTRHHPREA